MEVGTTDGCHTSAPQSVCNAVIAVVRGVKMTSTAIWGADLIVFRPRFPTRTGRGILVAWPGAEQKRGTQLNTRV